MTERKKQKVLIDAGVLLEHPDIIRSIREKQNWPVLLAEALTTLMERRSHPTVQGHHAERVLGQIEGSKASAIERFPAGDSLQAGDHLAEFRYDGAPAFLFKRLRFTEQAAAGRVIEVARDYGMTVVTRDDQVVSLAAKANVVCYKWPLVEKSRTSPKDNFPPVGSKEPDPFKPHKIPLSSADVRLVVKVFPCANENVVTSAGRQVRLGKKLSEGGEGVIYETSSQELVCKIYHPDKLTSLKRKKIELMVTRKIDRAGICWPTDLVFNQYAEFIGYLMPRAQGKTMQGAMFVKPVLLKTFPTWQRVDLVNLCLAFLEQLRYLHSLNILVGDINPQNLLVTQDSEKLWLVDTDSFQIEAFPCPVGTVNFTAPEIQGKGYESFLRSTQHELFAVATMLFMILFPGKPPYSQQGGGSPAENIKNKKFPYRDASDKENFSGENAPHGSWAVIWNHLSKDIQAAFHRSFSRDERLTLEEWIELLKRYRFAIRKNWRSNEIFPSSYFFIHDPVEVICGRCNTKTTASQKYALAQAKKGMKVWCQDCFKQNRLKRMAEESYKEGLEAEKKHLGRPAPIPQIPRAPVVPHPASPPHTTCAAAPSRPMRTTAHVSKQAAANRPTAQAQTATPRAATPPTQRANPQPRATPVPGGRSPIVAPSRARLGAASKPTLMAKGRRLLRRLWLAIFFN